MTDYMKEAERLRAAQSDAVMPLIGPLLDAWEGCSSTCREEFPEMDKWLRRINRAMEDAEPAAPAPEQIRDGTKMVAAPEGWSLDESAASLLHYLTSPDDDGEHSPITLREGNVRMDDGTVKFGLLCEYTDYPEEGATLLVECQTTSPDQFRDAAEMVPEFSDSARAALLWVLWHHQGGSSHIGQPIRFALGMGQHEHLNDWQVAEAKRWGASCGLGPGDCRDPAPAPAEVPSQHAGARMGTEEGGEAYTAGYFDGDEAGYARAANWLRTSAEKHAEENGYHEPDTGSFVFASCAAEEWNNSVLELADEMEAALRGEVKP